MDDHIFGYWDEPLGMRSPTPHTASGKSIHDRDGIEFMSLTDAEEKEFVEYFEQKARDREQFETTQDFQDWQSEIMEKEKIGDFRETKEKRFYGVVKVRKADLISPSEGELMSYYIDYGYTTIQEVIQAMGEEEMLREWYNNTNFTSEFSLHRIEHHINHLEWDSESEDVEVISENEWNDLKQWTW